MGYENNDKKIESVFSTRVKAGKRRTYFFDVRETRGNDFFLTITESRKRYDSDGYDRHKIFLYKEDFNKFLLGLTETIDHVKTELMPDYDFDSFSHDGTWEESQNSETEPSENTKVVTKEEAVIDNATLSTDTEVVSETPIDNASDTESSTPTDTSTPNDTHDEHVDKW